MALVDQSGATPRPRLWWTRVYRPSYVYALAVFAVVAYITTTGTSYSVYILNTILLAAVGAVALDLLMGTGGQVSLGNAAFLATGAFVTAWANRSDIAFPFDVLLGGGVCAIAGLVVGLPALRIRGLYLALATLAAYYFADFAGQRYQTDTVGAAGFHMDPVFEGTIAQQSVKWAWLSGGVLVGTIILFSWLRSGRTGRAWRMIRDHEVAAAMMGVPVARYKLLVFVVTSAVIGFQGGLTARLTGSVTFDGFPLALSISAIAMILIGGLDSRAGPLIGALVVTTLPLIVPDVLDRFSVSSSSLVAGAYAEIAYGVLIVFFIIAAPHGLSGLIQTASRRVVGAATKLVGVAARRRPEPSRDHEPANTADNLRTDNDTTEAQHESAVEPASIDLTQESTI